MDRPMESDRKPKADSSGRLPAAELVAKAGPEDEVNGRSERERIRKTGHLVNQPNASPSLDTLFQRILARKPDALALVDPENKARVTGDAPKRLTFAQADRAISALAAHFVDAGLPAHSVIAVQLPNTVEFVLTVLAAHRAGLVVALFPLLWRQAELVAALNRTSARAIVTCSKVDGIS